MNFNPFPAYIKTTACGALAGAAVGAVVGGPLGAAAGATFAFSKRLSQDIMPRALYRRNYTRCLLDEIKNIASVAIPIFAAAGTLYVVGFPVMAMSLPLAFTALCVFEFTHQQSHQLANLIAQATKSCLGIA